MLDVTMKTDSLHEPHHVPHAIQCLVIGRQEQRGFMIRNKVRHSFCKAIGLNVRMLCVHARGTGGHDDVNRQILGADDEHLLLRLLFVGAIERDGDLVADVKTSLQDMDEGRAGRDCHSIELLKKYMFHEAGVGRFARRNKRYVETIAGTCHACV